MFKYDKTHRYFFYTAMLLKVVENHLKSVLYTKLQHTIGMHNCTELKEQLKFSKKMCADRQFCRSNISYIEQSWLA